MPILILPNFPQNKYVFFLAEKNLIKILVQNNLHFTVIQFFRNGRVIASLSTATQLIFYGVLFHVNRYQF